MGEIRPKTCEQGKDRRDQLGPHRCFLKPCFLWGSDEGLLEPRVQIVSLYIDQIAADDVGQQLAAEYGITLFSSIRDALTLGGSRAHTTAPRCCYSSP